VSIDYDRLFFGNMSFVHDIRRAELIASLVHDIRREEMICIDYFLGTQDFAYERGRDEAAARGLAAVGKLTEIVEVENETWQGAEDRHDFETESTTRKMQVGKKGKELKGRNCEKVPSPARCALRTSSTVGTT